MIGRQDTAKIFSPFVCVMLWVDLDLDIEPHSQAEYLRS